MKKLYEIWCEGDPNRDFEACHLGYGKGTSLEEACLDLGSRNPFFLKHTDFTTGTYRGCRIFSCEADARELCG